MTFAITVGSYALPHFALLQIHSLRKVFGESVDILISDDHSSETNAIMAIAEQHGCHFCTSSARRGHFAGDIAAVVNSLGFAKQCNADVAVKLSQRMLIASPVIRERAEWYMSQPDIAIALPGTPARIQICGTSKGFSKFPWLTDVLFMRLDRMMPAEAIRDFYEASWKNSGDPRDGIPEIAMMHMIEKPLAGKARRFDELTYHDPNGREKLFHRRYQSTSAEIRRFAQGFGLDGFFQTSEWRVLDSQYSPRARA